MIKKILIYTVTLPWDLVCWLCVLAIRLFWGNKLWIENGSLWTELKPESWPSRSWYRIKGKDGKYIINEKNIVMVRGFWKTWGGTCLGHGGFYGPGISKATSKIDTIIEFHENVHVEQFEVGMFRGILIGGMVLLVLALQGDPVIGLVVGGLIWCLGYVHMAIPGWIVGYLRGEGAYKGSTHEEHARLSSRESIRKFRE